MKRWLLPAICSLLALLPTLSSAQPTSHVGFDTNDYPGDQALPALRKHFSFVGYWLTNPPEAHRNSWVGKRELVRQAGFGFLVLANGKLDREIRASKLAPEALGRRDAAAAIAAAKREGFPARTILFLDQEEGGRLVSEQMAYLLAWTETVANSGFASGVYASGQAVPDGPGKTLTTVQDIRDHVAAGHLHPVALWVYQDTCPPAPGCTLQPPRLAASGTPDALVWQYAQSPRRPRNTTACAETYSHNGDCNVGGGTGLDLDVADSSDPSHGR